MGIHKSFPLIVVMAFASAAGSAAAQDCAPETKEQAASGSQPLLLAEPPAVIGAQSTVTPAQPEAANRDQGRIVIARSSNRGRAQSARLDANRDGVITRAEFGGSRLAFAALDRNGDGVLTGAERPEGSRNR